MTRSAVTACVILSTMLNACSHREPIAAMELLNHGNCNISSAGVTLVDYADIAKIRGSNLLELQPGTGTQAPAENFRFVAVYRGEQPTPGYQLKLRDAWRLDSTITLELDWFTPSSDQVLAQVITRPCVVVGVEAVAANRVVAYTPNGEHLGEATIEAGGALPADPY